LRLFRCDAGWKLLAFDPGFSDKEVMRWDENFKPDGAMLLPCNESAEVDVAMHRRYISECIRYRDRVRDGLMAKA
jgi:hypothetical protein